MAIKLHEQSGNVTVVDDGRSLLVARGELGAGAATAIQAAFDAAPDIRWLIVDLSGVTGMDTAGLGALHAAAQRLAEDAKLLVLRDAPTSVAIALRASGLPRSAAIVPVPLSDARQPHRGSGVLVGSAR